MKYYIIVLKFCTSDNSDYNLFFTTIQLRTRKIIIQIVEEMACNDE